MPYILFGCYIIGVKIINLIYCFYLFHIHCVKTNIYHILKSSTNCNYYDATCTLHVSASVKNWFLLAYLRQYMSLRITKVLCVICAIRTVNHDCFETA